MGNKMTVNNIYRKTYNRHGGYISECPISYNDYLQTEIWQDISNKRKEIDNHRCVICGSSENIHVHHDKYPVDYWGKESIQDLRTLCADCHRNIHNKGE